jgi:hypothetical protein
LKNIVNIIIILFLLLESATIAQNEIDSSSKSSISEDSVFVMQKSPWGAVLRSAILPGWGQFYNESYWKAPIFIGALAGFIYGWIYYDDLYDKYRNLYDPNISGDPINNGYKAQRDTFRDERDLFAVYIGLTYLLNLVDAYVDAHLFDFDVSENLFYASPELRIKYYFNR